METGEEATAEDDIMKRLLVSIAAMAVIFSAAGCSAELPQITIPSSENEPAAAASVSTESAEPPAEKPALPAAPKPSDTGPFRSVDSAWSVSTVYEHSLIYPSSLCTGPDGDAFVYDRVKGSLFRIAQTDYSVTMYKDMNSSFPVNSDEAISCIAWLPNSEKFVFGLKNGAIGYYEPGTDATGLMLKGLKDYRMGWSYFEVNPEDDSFFASSQSPLPGGKIYRFTADMEAEVIVTDTQGVFQTAWSPAEKILYYTETYSGTLKRVNPETREVTTVLNNIGIPGTYEPIAAAYNPAMREINVFTAVDGLMKANGEVLMPPDSGVGTMCWWDAAGESGALTMVQNAGANIIRFDVKEQRSRALTDHVNAFHLACDKNGSILIDSPQNYGSSISKVDGSGISDYYRNTESALKALMNDAEGNVFAAWDNGEISIITEPGTDTAQTWTDGITDIQDMAHNPADNTIIVMRDTGTGSTELTGIEIDNPASRTVLATIASPRSFQVTCGSDGTIYALVWDSSGAFIIVTVDPEGNQSVLHHDIFRDNRAVALPGFTYSRETELLIVSTIEDIRLYPVDGGAWTTFAVSNGAVDIFTLTEDNDGAIVGMHSGRVFRFLKNEG